MRRQSAGVSEDLGRLPILNEDGFAGDGSSSLPAFGWGKL
jgi:hypothetical protein